MQTRETAIRKAFTAKAYARFLAIENAQIAEAAVRQWELTREPTDLEVKVAHRCVTDFGHQISSSLVRRMLRDALRVPLTDADQETK